MAGPGLCLLTHNRVDSSSHTPVSTQSSEGLHIGTSSSEAPLLRESNISTSIGSILTPEGQGSIMDSTILKRKRGLTRNIALAKSKEAGKKLSIEISEEDKRIVGPDSTSFITEGGCIVRKEAPLGAEKWSQISAVNCDILR